MASSRSGVGLSANDGGKLRQALGVAGINSADPCPAKQARSMISLGSRNAVSKVVFRAVGVSDRIEFLDKSIALIGRREINPMAIQVKLKRYRTHEIETIKPVSSGDMRRLSAEKVVGWELRVDPRELWNKAINVFPTEPHRDSK